MLTSRDKKALLISSGTPQWVKVFIVLCVLFFGLFAVAKEIYLAQQLGHVAGYSLKELAQIWFAGFSPGEEYRGIYVLAIQRIERAIYTFGAVIALAGIALTAFIYTGREKRIVEVLKKSGIWEEA